MGEPGRRWRFGGVLVGLGVLLCAAGAIVSIQLGPTRAELHATAEEFRALVGQALAARAQELGTRAAAAARLPEILSALELGADPHTAQDLLETEDWWAPFKSAFALSGLVAPAGPLALVVPGPRLALGDVTASPVIRQARSDGAAWGILVGRGRVFLVAARRVAARGRGAGGVVVLLGVPLDKTMLGALADQAAGGAAVALALSDGKRLLEVSGAEPLQGELRELVAQRVPGTATPSPGAAAPLVPGTVAAAGAGRVTAVWPLEGAAGFWLLATFPGPGAAPSARWNAALLVCEVLGAVAILFGLALIARSPRAQTPGGPGSMLAMAFAPADLPDGATTMGRYHLLERIGEGGMAEVFTAATFGPEGFMRQFVVKRMHPHLARNRAAVAQFIDEARLQAGLIHSNVVPVYDFGKADNEYYLAMEHINGRDLERVVRRHIEVFDRSLSVPVAFYIMQELMEALAYAHGQTDAQGRARHIVHRDIAPGNILISFRGEVKLTDFGIAKQRSDDAAARTDTDAGRVKGNAAFMSPEQARGEAVDVRSDLFSAGLVLYHCLTGQLLYGDSDPQFRRMLRVASGPETAEFERLKQVTPLAAEVLRKALAPDPANRYQDARAFGRDLVGHFTGGRAELADLMTELFEASASVHPVLATED